MQKLNDLSRSLTPLDPDGTLFRESTRPDHWSCREDATDECPLLRG
jgi:hypothetical protein